VINSGKLRELRILAGLSQRGLCKLAGIGPLGIKRIEDGADASRLPLQVVARIATALGVEITDLLSDLSCDPVPAANNAIPAADGLDLNQARLLRRIHRREDVGRRLTKVDQEMTLPSLMRAGLVHHEGGELAVGAAVRRALDLPH